MWISAALKVYDFNWTIFSLILFIKKDPHKSQLITVSLTGLLSVHVQAWAICVCVWCSRVHEAALPKFIHVEMMYKALHKYTVSVCAPFYVQQPQMNAFLINPLPHIHCNWYVPVPACWAKPGQCLGSIRLKISRVEKKKVKLDPKHARAVFKGFFFFYICESWKQGKFTDTLSQPISKGHSVP